MPKADQKQFQQLTRVCLDRDRAELLNTLLLSTLESVAAWGQKTGAFQSDYEEDQRIRRAVDQAIVTAKETTQ